MIKIILKGKPISVNSLYKTMCRGNFPTRYITPKGRELKESYQWQIKSQYKGPVLKGNIHLIVALYFGDKRANDIDNFQKILQDCMSNLVYVDDSQIILLQVSKQYDKKNPRVEMFISEV